MDKVFIITNGSIDDGHETVTTCSSRENAQAVIKAFGDAGGSTADMRIEECEIDVAFNHVLRGEMLYEINMRRDGSAWPVYLRPCENEHTFLYRGFGRREDCLCVRRWAISPEHVVKIANEIRIQKIANGEWPSDKAGE